MSSPLRKYLAMPGLPTKTSRWPISCGSTSLVLAAGLELRLESNLKGTEASDFPLEKMQHGIEGEVGRVSVRRDDTAEP